MNHKTNLGIRAVFTYRPKMEKRHYFCSAYCCPLRHLVLSGLAIADAQEEQTEELRGGDRGQLHRGTKSIHGWLGQRQWWFL